MFGILPEILQRSVPQIFLTTQVEQTKSPDWLAKVNKMEEATQYSFTLTEVAKALLRQQGITEGRWSLGFEQSLGVGAFGSTGADAKPGAMVQIGGVNLARVPDDAPPSPASYVVDAAEVET